MGRNNGDRDRTILAMLESGTDKAEVAKKFGVTPTRIDQIRKRAQGATRDPARNGTAASRTRGRRSAPAATPELDALTVVYGFELDYNLGNAVRFILERDEDGEPLAYLQTARVYLDRAIARLEA